MSRYIKDFLRRADTAANGMNPTDRKLLAAILEEMAVRLDTLEKERAQSLAGCPGYD